jgi:hypothetical protein
MITLLPALSKCRLQLQIVEVLNSYAVFYRPKFHSQKWPEFGNFYFKFPILGK